MNLCVIGTGYVGLVGAAIFAERGNKVVGVDINQEKIEKIRRGEMPIFETGLSEIVLKNIKDNKLSFTTSIKEGIKDAEVVMICVGTPQEDTGAADLSAVWAVAGEIGKNLNGYKVVVTKSTVPVGTNERIAKIVRENAPDRAEFDVASNPEFLREGQAVEDMRNSDRTVVGTSSPRAMEVLKKLYSDQISPIIECDLRSAEMIKYASNAFLATKISFINEIGQLCERAGADVSIVAKGMGMDKRIGYKFLNSSIGYGGSCFPKDVAALYKTSSDEAYDFKLLRSVMEVNDLQKNYFFKKITSMFGDNLSGFTYGILGLAFKNDTDDIRESVALKIVRMIRGSGGRLKVYDPAAMENTMRALGSDDIIYTKDMYDAVKDVDAVCILTEWSEFKNLDLDKTKSLMKKPVIFDGRNLLNQKEVEGAGFIYFAIGKRTNGYTEEADIIRTAVLQNGGNKHK